MSIKFSFLNILNRYMQIINGILNKIEAYIRHNSIRVTNVLHIKKNADQTRIKTDIFPLFSHFSKKYMTTV